MPFRRRRVPLALLVAFLGGCASGDVVSRYELRLEPRVPSNQDPFASGPQVSLVFRDALGDVEIRTLGELQSGSLTEEGFGVLDEVTVGVLLQSPNAAADGYDGDKLIAYGEVGPLSLAKESEPQVYEVLLPMFGAPGDMGTFSSGTIGGSSVMFADGTVLALGGGDKMTGGRDGSATIRRVTELDSDAWVVEEVGELPWKFALGTATVVERDDQEMVLIAGGYEGVSQAGAGFDPRYDWILWDPTTGEAVDGNDGFTKSMVSARGGHRAVRMNDGRALLVGGWGEGGISRTSTTYELFDPSSGKFGDSGTIDIPPLNFGLASLGASGALACGGSSYLTDGGYIVGYEPATYSDGGDDLGPCVRISLTGDTTTVAGLPLPVQAHAMARLADGTVLLTGGTPDTMSMDTAGAATDRAFLYDPTADSWTEVEPMNHARAMHEIVATADGRAVVIGGVEAANDTGWPGFDGTIECTEIFNPATGAFTESATCSSTGAGALPLVASHPAHGAFVVSGGGADGTGGDRYGIIGLPPAL